MKYKNVSITVIVFIIIIALIVGYFCFASLSASFGYDKGGNTEKHALAYISSPVTVIIDAGHGGIDPGAVANGLIEKDLNLEVALKLNSFLSLANVKVVMTRSDDVLLGEGETIRKQKISDLKKRLEILSSQNNCVFVSIHMNKFEQSTAHGLQVFYAGKSDEARKLAQLIQDYSKLIDETNTRNIKPDGGNIYILENTDKTAILVECGFLSNNKDAVMLSTDEYKNKLAFIIYSGIIKYLQEYSDENSVRMQ